MSDNTKKYEVLHPVAWGGRRERGEILELTATQARDIGLDMLKLVDEGTPQAMNEEQKPQEQQEETPKEPETATPEATPETPAAPETPAEPETPASEETPAQPETPDAEGEGEGKGEPAAAQTGEEAPNTGEEQV